MSNMASDAKACFSSKVEYRAVIRYLYFKGKTGKGVVGWCEGVVYLVLSGRPTDIGLQLGKACYPCSR